MSAPHKDAAASVAEPSLRIDGGVQQVLVSSQLGGAGLIAIGLAEMVKARRLASQAWVPGPGAATAAFDAADIPWTAYSLDALKRGGLPQISTWLTMGAGLGRSRGSVIHVHDPTVYGLLSPMLRFIRARSIAHFHIEPTREEIRWTLRHPPSVVVTCAKYIGAQIRAVAEEAGRHLEVAAVPNAIDITRFPTVDRRAAKRRVGAPEDRRLILMLANLSEHKGQLTALRSLKHLLDRGIAVDCWLAGEERDGTSVFTERLRACAHDLGIEGQTRLLGFRSDGPALLQAADFFLLPSTHEGLPLSVLEAQAVGAVAIGSPIPGIREVVEDGVTGFLVEADDATGYADRIQQLVNNPDLYDRVASQAQARVHAEHSWERYVDRIWALYASLAKGR